MYTILCLPDEILDLVCINLEGHTALQLSFTCKRFCNFILPSKYLWYKYCLLDYGYKVSGALDQDHDNFSQEGIHFKALVNKYLIFYLKILSKYWRFIKNTNKRQGNRVLLTYVKLEENTPHLNWSLMIYRPERYDYTIYKLFSLSPLSCHKIIDHKQTIQIPENGLKSYRRNIKVVHYSRDNVVLQCLLCHNLNINCMPFCYLDHHGHLMYHSTCLKKLWSSSDQYLSKIQPVIPLSRFIRSNSKQYTISSKRKHPHKSFGFELLFGG